MWESAEKPTSRDFTCTGASCDVVWGPGITYGLLTTHKLSDQLTSNGLFYWRFAGLNAIAVICRLGPCAAVRQRSFRGRSLGSAPSALPLSRLALLRRCVYRRARE